MHDHVPVRIGIFVVTAALSAAVARPALADPAEASAESVLDARETYLLLDDRVVHTVENAKLAVGTVVKHPRNPLFEEDKPWEQRFDNLYASVIYDAAGGRYRCWYCPFIYDTSAKGMSLEERRRKPYRVPRREEGVCHATSRDGLRWEKPELGLVVYEGSTENNLVVRGAHGAGVFKDAHDPDPKRRYKMFHARDRLRFSPDGLHWSDSVSCEGVGSKGDTHNNMLWAPDLERYVAFVRLRDRGQRIVGRTESTDLKQWTKATEVLRSNRRDQAYSMPVFRYAGVYLGLVAIFRTGEDRVHTELAWSPDTRVWHRIEPGTPFIDNAPREGDYDWGCVYAADEPVVLDNEIRVYYLGSNGKHTSWRDGFFCLATLRPDGWAGYEPIDRTERAVVVTHAIPYDGSPIRITADVEAGGSVEVSVLDRNGTRLASARPVIASVTNAELQWPGAIEADAVRLRFEFRGAAIFSFGTVRP